MSDNLELLEEQFSYDQWRVLLNEINYYFVPSISTKTDLDIYAAKLASNANTLLMMEGNTRLGILVYYANSESKDFAFITLFLVWPQYVKNKIGKDLMISFIKQMKDKGISTISLEVHSNNIKAIEFYTKNNFILDKKSYETIFFKLNL